MGVHFLHITSDPMDIVLLLRLLDEAVPCLESGIKKTEQEKRRVQNKSITLS